MYADQRFSCQIYYTVTRNMFQTFVDYICLTHICQTAAFSRLKLTTLENKQYLIDMKLLPFFKDMKLGKSKDILKYNCLGFVSFFAIILFLLHILFWLTDFLLPICC